MTTSMRCLVPRSRRWTRHETTDDWRGRQRTRREGRGWRERANCRGLEISSQAKETRLGLAEAEVVATY